jgi:hypothetical protein
MFSPVTAEMVATVSPSSRAWAIISLRAAVSVLMALDARDKSCLWTVRAHAPFPTPDPMDREDQPSPACPGRVSTRCHSILFPAWAGMRLPSNTKRGSLEPPRGRQKPFLGQWNPVRALIDPRVGFEIQLVWLIFFTAGSFDRARRIPGPLLNYLIIR